MDERSMQERMQRIEQTLLDPASKIHIDGLLVGVFCFCHCVSLFVFVSVIVFLYLFLYLSVYVCECVWMCFSVFLNMLVTSNGYLCCFVCKCETVCLDA